MLSYCIYGVLQCWVANANISDVIPLQRMASKVCPNVWLPVIGLLHWDLGHSLMRCYMTYTLAFYCHLKLGSSFYYANSKIRWLACMYCTMYTLPMPKFYIWLVEAQNLGVILKICLWSWVEQLLFPKGAICQKIKAYIIWVVCVCIIVQVYFSNHLLLVYQKITHHYTNNKKYLNGLDIPLSFPPVAPIAKTMPESHIPSHSITLETFLATKIMRLTEWENYTLVHKKYWMWKWYLEQTVLLSLLCYLLLTSNSKKYHYRYLPIAKLPIFCTLLNCCNENLGEWNWALSLFFLGDEYCKWFSRSLQL